MKKKLFLFGFMLLFVVAFARQVVAEWTSTCGVSHTTTFTGDWSNGQIAQYIALINEVECGVRPRVTFNP